MTDGMSAVAPATSEAVRLLVFFPQNSAESSVADGLAAVRAGTERTVDLVDSLAWYENRFASCGDWDSWALEAVTGKSYRSRQPYFHGFVLTGGGEVGQGTAKVALLALSMGKSVYWLNGTKLCPVVKMDRHPHCWRINTGESS
jgi:hypothetical protein